jgi:formamidopyrimidine-DNA glycosylase
LPELPEVESIAQALQCEIVGQRIDRFTIGQPLIMRGPYQNRWKKVVYSLKNKKIAQVFRRAKRLIIATDASLALIVQLGMTGRFTLATDHEKMEKHTHFYLGLSDGKQLRFVDPRRFGKLWVIDLPDGDVEAAMVNAGMTRLGPEPFGLTGKTFHRLLDSSRPIKSLLLDQTRIAGLGNIYADESLFISRIHPITPACQISPTQSAALIRAVKQVLKKSIAQGGTTFSDYKNPYGDMGKFFNMLKVYQRSGQPCKRCRNPIQKFTLTGRTTHYCPTCQPPAL